MLSARWRKVIADLWSNKTRSLLVVISIAIGVMAIGAIMGGSQVLSREMTTGYAATNPTGADIYVSGVDEDLVRSLTTVPGVADAEGRGIYTVRFRVGDQEWKRLRLTAIQNYDRIRIGRIRPEAGAWPPPNRELLIERASLAYTGAQVGDTLLIEAPDGTQREMRIAGLAYDMGEISPTFQGIGAGYISLETLQWLGLPDTYTRISIVTDAEHASKAAITEVAEAVKQRIEKSDGYVGGSYVPTPGKHPADEVVQPVFMLLGVMGALALGLGGLLVFNTISAILSQQVVFIGIMKAVGARRGQIIGQYLVLVMTYGLLALCLSVPLGALGANSTVVYMGGLLNAEITSFVAPAQVYIIQAIVALVVPVVAAAPAVLRSTRVTVRVALNPSGLADGARQGLVDRVLARVRGVSRPLLLSLRNTFRRKGRLALTLMTLTMAGAIFIGVISVRASLMGTLDEALDYWNYEATLNLRRPYRITEITEQALAYPQVEGAECWAQGTAQRVLPDGSLAKMVYMIAPPADTKMIKPTLLEGRWLLPEDENAAVINSLVLRDDPDIKVGDEIVLQFTMGSDTIERTWKVVGLVKGVMTGPLVYVNYPYYAQTIGWVNRASSVQIQLRTDDPVAQKRIARELEERFNAAGLRVSNREVLQDTRELIWGQLTIIVSLLLVMSALFAVVGGLGLMGTMSINVLERTREIGVMRAIGANDRAVLKIVIVEGVFIGVVSWAAGSLLALPLSQMLTAALGQAVIRSSVTVIFPPYGMLMWLGLAVVIAVLSSYLPARKASSLTVRDVLAYQ
jgi:putative ABC transport system permease protein